MNFFKLVSISLIFISNQLIAEQDVSADLVANQDYSIIAPPSVNEPLVEKFFNYACAACFNMDSFLTQLRDNQPNLTIELQPVSLNSAWEIYTKAYLIGQKLDVLEKSHHKLFHRLHVEKKPLSNDKDMKKFFLSLGVAEKDYNEVADSYWLSTQIRLSKQYAFKHKITALPTLIVNKRYKLDLKALKVVPRVEKAIVELSGLNNYNEKINNAKN
jgi:thiol:disulfide interchange protein DsbA